MPCRRAICAGDVPRRSRGNAFESEQARQAAIPRVGGPDCPGATPWARQASWPTTRPGVSTAKRRKTATSERARNSDDTRTNAIERRLAKKTGLSGTVDQTVRCWPGGTRLYCVPGRGLDASSIGPSLPMTFRRPVRPSAIRAWGRTRSRNCPRHPCSGSSLRASLSCERGGRLTQRSRWTPASRTMTWCAIPP